MKAFKRDLPIMGKEQFVRYASVTGDFNPVHYDLEFAKHLKLPSVISQGPLTFTLALDAVASEVGLDDVTGMVVRTTAPVSPDTRLSATCDSDGAITVGDGDVTYLTGRVKSR